MTSDILSLKPSKCPVLKPPRQPFSLDYTFVQYERLQHPQRRKPNTRAKQEGSLSVFTLIPVDILYEIVTHLHPQDVLNLSRSTRRLRQLLMTRDARFVWKSALSNVEGLPSCPFDLSEPQFANLAFDEHCHLCLAPRVKIVLWSCRVRSCKACLSKCFLTMDQLALVLPKSLDIPKPETIFLNTIYPSMWNHFMEASSGHSGAVLFYKPIVEAYLRELAELDNINGFSLSLWCRAKRGILDEIAAHAALCEHWTCYWAYSDTSHQLYDFGFTLCLLGLLVFLWKDKLFY